MSEMTMTLNYEKETKRYYVYKEEQKPPFYLDKELFDGEPPDQVKVTITIEPVE